FYQGGEGNERVTALAVDSQERVYIGGVTQSEAGIATTGAQQATPAGLESAYVAMFRTDW
ncbi:MAG TPA: hypothetical protein VM869_28630, partial [Enhygromyxa sp.]|nr:hypothetical protein [Enhygromyxa sp.]